MRCGPRLKAGILAEKRPTSALRGLTRSKPSRICLLNVTASRRTGRTVEGTERLLRQYVLPRWKGRLAREITRRDVIELLDRVVDSGKPTTANRVLAAVRKMFNWAVARDILHATPCVGVEPPADEQSRNRVLTDGELRNVWMSAQKIGWPYGAL